MHIELINKAIDYVSKHEGEFIEGQEESIKELISNIENIHDIISITDQEIKNEVLKLNLEEERFERFFKILTEVKNILSVEKRDEENTSKLVGDELNKYKTFLVQLGLPEEFSIDLSDEKMSLEFKVGADSEITKLVEEATAWDDVNVEDTWATKFGVPIENVKLIGNVSDYIDYVSAFDNSTNYVSRGQKDCSFELKPSLHRIHSSTFKVHSHSYESQFKQKVAFYDSTIKDKVPEEIRAYGQHYGLPTNYLDFTEAHLTSLLFAVEEYSYEKNHSIVYFVDAVSYHQNVIKEEIKLVDFSDSNFKHTKEASYADQSYFVKVGNSHDRIHFQKGCFLKVEPNNDLQNMLTNHSRIAIIKKDTKKLILTELFNLGITFENIYPDIDNLVKTIKFSHEEK